MATELNFHRCDRCSRFVFVPPTATTTPYCRDCSSTSTDTTTPPPPPPTTASTPFDSVQNYDELVNYLRTDTSSYQPRPTPTAASFINSLKNRTLDFRVLKFLNTCSCAICSEDFKLGETVDRLPCRHWFHSNCVRTWLNLKNTCPLCRHKFPAQPDHVLPQSPSERSVSTATTSEGPMGLRRRARISYRSWGPLTARRTARIRAGAWLPNRRLAEDTLNMQLTHR